MRSLVHHSGSATSSNVGGSSHNASAHSPPSESPQRVLRQRAPRRSSSAYSVRSSRRVTSLTAQQPAPSRTHRIRGEEGVQVSRRVRENQWLQLLREDLIAARAAARGHVCCGRAQRVVCWASTCREEAPVRDCIGRGRLGHATSEWEGQQPTLTPGSHERASAWAESSDKALSATSTHVPSSPCSCCSARKSKGSIGRVSSSTRPCIHASSALCPPRLLRCEGPLRSAVNMPAPSSACTWRLSSLT